MKKYLKKCFRHISFIILNILIFTENATAATTNTTFQVTATILDACSVSANPLNFGSYVYTANSDQITTINVTCTNGTTYKIGLDAGLAPGATTSTRKMRGTPTTNILNYFLYSDFGRTTNWGNIVGTDTVAGTGNGTTQGVIVYGRIPSGQNTAFVDSTYTDTITVTLTFP
ncbi:MULTISPECIES: spore coat U domain-containing protein [unclassified Rickettsia]|uniref:Csu type fimbrial protein n=1 Tax=unclassified Rickettsia TaxID=114295 RepID=UPI00209E8AF7|nr:spore coat U domain-containing protein [Rickettsia endosymbiont of Ceutorhynchus assimilis]